MDLSTFETIKIIFITLIPFWSIAIFYTLVQKRYKIELHQHYLIMCWLLTKDLHFWSIALFIFYSTLLMENIATHGFSAFMPTEYEKSLYPFYIFFLGFYLFVLPFTYYIPNYPSIFFQNDFIRIYSPIYIAHVLFYIFVIRSYLDKFAIYIGNKILEIRKAREEAREKAKDMAKNSLEEDSQPDKEEDDKK